jgi:hypothetical protein
MLTRKIRFSNNFCNLSHPLALVLGRHKNIFDYIIHLGSIPRLSLLLCGSLVKFYPFIISKMSFNFDPISSLLIVLAELLEHAKWIKSSESDQISNSLTTMKVTLDVKLSQTISETLTSHFRLDSMVKVTLILPCILSSVKITIW